MAVSDDESKIGIVLGRIIVKDEQEITEIAIYKNQSFEYEEVEGNPEHNQEDYWLEKSLKFQNRDACIQFCFAYNNSDKLLFFTKEDVY